MFLLVSAHSSCPGQNPESHKMVVGVYVLRNFVSKLAYSITKRVFFSTHFEWLGLVLQFA